MGCQFRCPKMNQGFHGKLEPADQLTGKPRSRWQTKALAENLDPEWKEEREPLASVLMANLWQLNWDDSGASDS